VKHDIVIENVYAAACYCLIRVILFHETLHLTPFCTNHADTPNLSPAVVAGLRVRFETPFVTRDVFVQKICSWWKAFVNRGSTVVAKSVWHILVLPELCVYVYVCVCVCVRENDYAVVFTYLCFPYSHVHANQNYLVGLQCTIRNVTDKPSLSQQALQTYTNPGEAKTASRLDQTSAMCRNVIIIIIIIFIYCIWVVTRWQWLLYTYFLTLIINLLREGHMRSM
jgi:hypothetical protein